MQDENKKRHNVIVFSTPTCPWCVRVKQYLKEKNITFKDVDVSKDMAAAMEMVRKSGQQGVPQLWIDGRVVVGFNKPLIDNYLGIN